MTGERAGDVKAVLAQGKALKQVKFRSYDDTMLTGNTSAVPDFFVPVPRITMAWPVILS